MNIFSQTDITFVNNNISEIEKKGNQYISDNYEPTTKTISNVNKLILKFIKDNNRKIYGGYAQNMTVKKKNPEDAFYDKYSMCTADIDFFSPTPIEDLHKLCDIIYEAGYKETQGASGAHEGVYSIFVTYHNVCDISYVPTNIFHKIPYIEIDEIKYSHPNFMIMDYLRMFTTPIDSMFRWTDKYVSRFYVLQKNYPIKHFKGPVKLPEKSIPSKHYKALKDVWKDVSKDNVLIGTCAYQKFAKYCKNKKTCQDQKFNTPVFFYELISQKIDELSVRIMSVVKSKYPKSKIEIKEYVRFWHFSGRMMEIYLDNILLVKIHDYNDECSPFVKFPGLSPKIGSYSLVLRYLMSETFRYRMLKNLRYYEYYNKLVSYFVEIRINYFKNNKIKTNIINDPIFKDFIIECEGEVVTEKVQRMRKLMSKKKSKKLITYRYDPVIKRPPTEYKFSNMSGNPKQLKSKEKQTKEEIQDGGSYNDNYNNGQWPPQIQDRVSLKHPQFIETFEGIVTGKTACGNSFIVKLSNYQDYIDRELLLNGEQPVGRIILKEHYEWNNLSESNSGNNYKDILDDNYKRYRENYNIGDCPESRKRKLNDPMCRNPDESLLRIRNGVELFNTITLDKSQRDGKLYSISNKLKRRLNDELNSFQSPEKRNVNGLRYRKKMEDVDIDEEGLRMIGKLQQGIKKFKFNTDLKLFVSNGYVNIMKASLEPSDVITKRNVGDLKHFKNQYGKPINYHLLKHVLPQNNFQHNNRIDREMLEEVEKILSEEYLVALQPEFEYSEWFILRLLKVWFANNILEKGIRRIKVLINNWRSRNDIKYNWRNGVLPSILVYLEYGKHNTRQIISELSKYFGIYEKFGDVCSDPSFFDKINNLTYQTNGSVDLKIYYKGVVDSSNNSIKNTSFVNDYENFEGDSIYDLETGN